jgi:acetyl esterase
MGHPRQEFGTDATAHDHLRLIWTNAEGPAPEALHVIERLRDVGVSPSKDIESVRWRYERSRKPLLAALEPVDSVFHVLPRAGEAPPVSVIRPAGTASKKDLPAILFLHGGGWTVGTFETYEPLCRQIANATGNIVIWVRYRLAPEHPFPAAYDDARKSLRWVHANSNWLGIDPRKISVVGDSAGGNLAAALCLAEREDHSPFQPRAQILLYPCLDMRASLPSHRELAEGYLLTADIYRWYRQNYVGDFPKPTHWRLSPLFAHDVRKLPPAVVLYAGFDPLRDEAAAYAGRLRESGVPVESLYFADMIHGFITMGGVIPAAKTAIERVAHSLARLTDG